jgi:hypothetical protein
MWPHCRFASVPLLFRQGTSSSGKVLQGAASSQAVCRASRAARISTKAAAEAAATETAAPGDFVEVHYTGEAPGLDCAVE